MKDSDTILLETVDLKIGYQRRGRPTKIVADNINVALEGGELVCLMGPNGSGKSTLIKTLAGMHRPLKGDIFLLGDSIKKLTAKTVARKLSTVLTDRLGIGNLDVFTLVSFGRSPYTGWLGRLRKEDEEVVRWAISATGMESFIHRDISTLSDGERQKALIARALAQDTRFIMLDEPTAHLDLPNRVEIMRLLRKLARETGKGILLSTHELDLALKAGDTCWLINNHQQIFTGVPEDLVLNGTFEAVFEDDSFDFDRATGSFNLHQGNGRAVALSGNHIGTFWTRRALEREGFEVGEEKEGCFHIEVREEGDRYMWKITEGEGKETAQSIRELIHSMHAWS